MEYIARQINDEEIFIGLWLTEGVADEDIKYGSIDIGDVDEYYLEDDNFRDLMDNFILAIMMANESGGLYCGGIATERG